MQSAYYPATSAAALPVRIRMSVATGRSHPPGCATALRQEPTRRLPTYRRTKNPHPWPRLQQAPLRPSHEPDRTSPLHLEVSLPAPRPCRSRPATGFRTTSDHPSTVSALPPRLTATPTRY